MGGPLGFPPARELLTFTGREAQADMLILLPLRKCSSSSGFRGLVLGDGVLGNSLQAKFPRAGARKLSLKVNKGFSNEGGSKRHSLSTCACSSQPSTSGSWEEALLKFSDATANMYPLFVAVGGLIAVIRPTTFHWFTSRAPLSYSTALGIIMLAMGLKLQFRDLIGVVAERPGTVLFGFISQFTIMPAIGFLIAHSLNLSPPLKAGLILLSCCPGGTASNVVTYIARGDVALSIVMTIASTFGAVLLTPMLTKMLTGTLVPVDALGLALSTLKVVLAPVLIGAWIQGAFPSTVAKIATFSPLVSVLVSSLLASSVFSANAPLFFTQSASGLAGVAAKAAPLSTLASALARLASSAGLPLNHPLAPAAVGLGESVLESSLPHVRTLVLAVLLLHGAGFLLGYTFAHIRGLSEVERRSISIEVGMQNSSLGVVLATKHFPDPSTPLSAALSAVLMNIMGSLLAVIWRQQAVGK